MDASKDHPDVGSTNYLYFLPIIYSIHPSFADDCLMPILDFGRQCYNSPNGVNQCAKETIEVFIRKKCNMIFNENIVFNKKILFLESEELPKRWPPMFLRRFQPSDEDCDRGGSRGMSRSE